MARFFNIIYYESSKIPAAMVMDFDVEHEEEFNLILSCLYDYLPNIIAMHMNHTSSCEIHIMDIIEECLAAVHLSYSFTCNIIRADTIGYISLGHPMLRNTNTMFMNCP